MVVGLPLSLDGGDSDQTREARRFAAVLEKRLDGIPVELYDERFTTVLAQRDGERRQGRARARIRAPRRTCCRAGWIGMRARSMSPRRERRALWRRLAALLVLIALVVAVVAVVHRLGTTVAPPAGQAARGADSERDDHPRALAPAGAEAAA